MSKQLKTPKPGEEHAVRPSSHAHYGEPLYWDQRYEFENKRSMETGLKLFDWYAPFDKVYPLVESVVDVTKKHKILVIGVGRSNIVQVLVEKGFTDVVAIDISPYIIAQMSQKFSHYGGVEFLVLDARDLSYFTEKTFTLIVDKGCMDALFCGTNFLTDITQFYSEIFRVLKPEGQFLSFSHAAPPSRVPYLRSVRWSIETCSVPEGEDLTMYFMTKTSNDALIDRKIAGAEAAVKPKVAGIVSSLDQTMNKKSTTRNKEGSGSLTVTASADVLADLVRECGERTA